MKAFSVLALLLLCVGSVFGQAGVRKWWTATEKELRGIIPARATVEKERIETEFRTASAVTDGKGRFIAGVVMITAGYSAEGKYSHFFITHVPIRCGEVELRPGEYVFGYKRTPQDTLEVKFYEASTGKFLGDVIAHQDPRKAPVRQLVITSAAGSEKPAVRIGRFLFEYSIAGL